jgi:hypothetical protein
VHLAEWREVVRGKNRLNPTLGQLHLEPVCQGCQARQLIPRVPFEKLLYHSRRVHWFFTDTSTQSPTALVSAQTRSRRGPSGEAEPHRRCLECNGRRQPFARSRHVVRIQEDSRDSPPANPSAIRPPSIQGGCKGALKGVHKRIQGGVKAHRFCRFMAGRGV